MTWFMIFLLLCLLNSTGTRPVCDHEVEEEYDPY